MGCTKHRSAGTNHDSDGTRALSAYLNTGVPALAESAEPIVPASVEVETFRVVYDVEANEHRLIPGRRPLVGAPDAKSRRPGKFTKLTLAGGALLDSFFEGGEGFTAARDSEIWTAALDFAREERIRGRHLTSLSEAVLLGLAIRAGMTRVHIGSLPL